jgi:hypothetical protein
MYMTLPEQCLYIVSKAIYHTNTRPPLAPVVNASWLYNIKHLEKSHGLDLIFL